MNVGDVVTIGRRDRLAPRYRVRAIRPDGTALLRELATSVPTDAPVAMLVKVDA